MEDLDAVLDLVSRREDFLAYLADGPSWKRDLVDDLDHSRSTVDRAVRDLEDAGLVERVDGGYTTTTTGHLLAEAYRDYRATSAGVLETAELVDHLPPGRAVPPQVVAEAEAIIADGATPYRPLEQLREAVNDAERLRVLAPTLYDPTFVHRIHDRVREEGVAIEVVLSPTLAERLESDFPDVGADLRAHDADLTVAELTTPGLIIADRADETELYVIVGDGRGSLRGVLRTAAPAAVAWAERELGDAQARGEDLYPPATGGDGGPEPGRTATDAGVARAGNSEVPRPGEPAALPLPLRQEGFVRVAPETMSQRETLPPETAWRAGLDLAEVCAGYAVDREIEQDGRRRRLTETLLEALADGGKTALVGPPGSGKSTACMAVACEWQESGRGPVVYRPSGRDAAFESTALLAEYLNQADGQALVVVEDAVRPEAEAVFDLVREVGGTEGMSVLVDAVESEWQDPPGGNANARREALRRETFTVIRMPGLDAQERHRFREKFEELADVIVETPADEPEAGPASEAGPGEVLSFMHRLAVRASPVETADRAAPTSLREDVAALYETMEAAGETALEVALLANLLNAAGEGPRPEQLHALAIDTDRDLEAVREAVDRLEGRVLFEPGGQTGHAPVPYRTIHEAWSVEFLKHALGADAEATGTRVQRTLADLLDGLTAPGGRERLRARFGESEFLGRIDADPTAWVDATLEAVHGVGLTRPGLAPVFGTYADDDRLTAVCSEAMAVRLPIWRGEMAVDDGRLDRAEAEFDAARRRLDTADRIDPETAARLEARHARQLGHLHRVRGDLDAAEAAFRESLATSREIDDRRQVASLLNDLGIVAWGRGEYETAGEWFDRSLAEWRAVGDPAEEAQLLMNRSLVDRNRGDMATARDGFEQAMRAGERAGDRELVASAAYNLGKGLMRHTDDLEAAEGYLRRSLELRREVGARTDEAHTLLALGHLHRRREAFAAAERYVRDAREAWAAVGDDLGLAHADEAFGELARDRGDPSTARERFRAAADRYDAADRPESAADCFEAVAELARAAGDTAAAREAYAAAVERYRGVDAPAAAIEAAERLIACCEQTGDTAAAADWCGTAADLADTAGLEERQREFEAQHQRLAEASE